MAAVTLQGTGVGGGGMVVCVCGRVFVAMGVSCVRVFEIELVSSPEREALRVAVWAADLLCELVGILRGVVGVTRAERVLCNEGVARAVLVVDGAWLAVSVSSEVAVGGGDRVGVGVGVCGSVLVLVLYSGVSEIMSESVAFSERVSVAPVVCVEIFVCESLADVVLLSTFDTVFAREPV